MILIATASVDDSRRRSAPAASPSTPREELFTAWRRFVEALAYEGDSCWSSRICTGRTCPCSSSSSTGRGRTPVHGGVRRRPGCTTGTRSGPTPAGANVLATPLTDSETAVPIVAAGARCAAGRDSPSDKRRVVIRCSPRTRPVARRSRSDRLDSHGHPVAGCTTSVPESPQS